LSNDVRIIVSSHGGKAVRDDFDATGKKAGGLGSALSSALRTGALAGGAALAGLGVASLKMAADFETGFAEVKTLLPTLSEEAFGKLQKDIIGVSKEFGIATNQSIPALYQAISAGVPPDNVVEFMGVAAKASIGGVTDLETAVDGITSVVNSYGSEVISAQEASDQMFTAVKLGKTDFTQLSSALFNVIPTASAAGVSFGDVASQLAVITASGTPTSVATTQIRAAMNEATQSGSKFDKAIRELNGVGFAELIKSGKTMPQIFDELRSSMSDEEFTNLRGSAEGFAAVLGITGDKMAAVDDAFQQMATSAGATDAAAKTIQETFSFKLNKAINEAKIALMELGLQALPHVTAALEVVVPWLKDHVPEAAAAVKEVFDDLKPTLESFASAFVTGLDTIREALTPVVEYILGNKIVLIAAITAIGVAILVAFGPGAVAIAALVGLITVIGLVRDNWDELKAKVDEAVGSIITTIEGLPVIGEIAMAVFETLKTLVETYFKGYVLFIETALAEIINIFQFWKAIFSGDWDKAWQEFKEIHETAWNAMLAAAELILGALLTLVQGIPARLLAALGDLGTLLYGAGAALIRGLKDGAESFVTGTVLPFITGLPGRIVAAMGDASGRLWQWGRDLIQGLINGMLSVPIPNPLDLIPDLTPGFEVPGIPGFQSGGTVPGPTGKPRLAVVHGGEQVIPVGGGSDHARDGSAGGSAPIFYIYALDGASVERVIPQIAEALQRHMRGTGAMGLAI
jgi:TP901 family phage tail tape measure protein